MASFASASPSSATSSSSSSLGPLALFVEIADGGYRGRVLKTRRAFKAGDAVFADTALIGASWNEDECIECATVRGAQSHPSSACPRLRGLGYPEALASNIEAVELAICHALVPEEGEDDGMNDDDDEEVVNPLDYLDKARCIIKFIVRCGARDGVEKVLRPVQRLTVANQARDAQTIARIRQLPEVVASGLLPADASQGGLTDLELTQFLGGLNTNSHTLDMGGSAMFMIGAMMQSDCAPNCAYFTHARGTRLSVVALRPLAVGESISIDYGNNFYRPTEFRRTGLRGAYGFTCACSSCTTLVDTCRAFYCPVSTCSGVVSPRGEGDAPGSWQCTACSRTLSEEERTHFVSIEQRLMREEPLDSEEACDAAIAKHRIHPTHHIIFWCLHALGELGLEMANQLEKGEAARIWRRVISLASSVLPPNHPELVLLHDKLAQVECMTGNRSAAVEAWSTAYELACKSSDVLTRRHIKRLRDNPPGDLPTMRAIYDEQAASR